MKPLLPLFLLALMIAASSGCHAAAPVASAAPRGNYHEVVYPPSQNSQELQLGVLYRLWIPEGVKRIRGVIVHQHGCGAGACKGGETASYDLHWQALARKWDCALLGPSYQQSDKQDCRLWYDPRNGSNRTFLRALRDLGHASGHPELEQAPWCLWGHSGGGFWSSLMQTLYPERIIAIWLRSGTAYPLWEQNVIPKPNIPEAAYQIPVMCNPAVKEKGDARFDLVWTGSLSMFHAYRAKGAPIGFAPDPRTSHECGDSRYLAIPFFDACLKARLPRKAGAPLRKIMDSDAWLAPLQGTEATVASEFSGTAGEAVWLPNQAVAQAWQEYVRTGAVGDTTPPPAPYNVEATPVAGGIRVRWEARADFESGIRSFVILKDGKELAQFPTTPVGVFGRPLFQAMSYHDTPEAPVPSMEFLDKDGSPGSPARYRVIAVNGVGLRSRPSKPSPKGMPAR
jgi:hypothetical protein